MKIIAIGDIHGRIIWKDIIAKEWNKRDKVVFIGDYFDTHENTTGEQQLSNFKNIVAFRDANPEDIVLLLGNHDFHYLDVNERYSGYQQGWSYEFREVLYKELKKLQICYIYGHFLFSHAGVSKTWLQNQDFNDSLDLEEYINDLLQFKPLSFRFTVGKNYSNYGDDVTQSPIWIRLDSLYRDGIDNYTQIVGHTTRKSIIPFIGGKIYPIDTLGTSKEYLVIEDSKIIVKSL